MPTTVIPQAPHAQRTLRFAAVHARQVLAAYASDPEHGSYAYWCGRFEYALEQLASAVEALPGAEATP